MESLYIDEHHRKNGKEIEQNRRRGRGKKPLPPLYTFTFFTGDRTMKQTYTKPEAMGIIADTLEKAGLYEPIKPYTEDEFFELTARKNTLALSGRTKQAEHINKSLHHHAPEYIRKLQTATARADSDSRIILDPVKIRKETPNNIRA